MRILLLTRSLEPAGTERQIVALAKGLRCRGHEVQLAAFYQGGALENEVTGAGIPVVSLDKRGRYDIAGPLRRLVRLVDAWRPDVLYSFLVEPNVMSALAKRLRPRLRVVWGVRASAFDRVKAGRFAAWTFRIAAWLSRQPDVIVYNSAAGRAHHEQLGYPSERGVVIANGVDTDSFSPGDASAVRDGWGLGADDVAVGIVGRLDPLKGHEVFLEAAARARQRAPAFRFVLVGPPPGPGRERLAQSEPAAALDERLVWAGPVEDMAAIYPALDLLCLSSHSEGLPNVVLEAMACGVPAVVTDVGDAAVAVGDTGVVCPPGDADALADGLVAMHERLRAEPDLGARARMRIVEEYSLDRMVTETANVLAGNGEKDHDRFAFGRNWERFVLRVQPAHVDEAVRALDGLVGSTLDGVRFLDIGCGSGLHSLAARRLGAEVWAFDYDPDAVRAAQALRDRFAPEDPAWRIEQGSALDEDYLDGLGKFDIVYSWGVLHHTGDMWRAIDLAAGRVSAGGRLVLALYNDQGWQSTVWRTIKATYVRVPPLRWLLLGLTAPLFLGPQLLRDLVRLRPGASWREYKRRRGMSPWTDLVDWVGGYPYEVATAETVRRFLSQRGFIVECERLTKRLGCNEFVFRRAG